MLKNLTNHLILPGSGLQGQVAATLLLMTVGHEVVLVPVRHGQAVGHETVIARLLQHLAGHIVTTVVRR